MTTIFRTTMLLAFALTLTACELVGDIFQVGFWAGAVVVVLIAALIAWFFQRGKS
jgi:uncharacterized membrane-anchored protein